MTAYFGMLLYLLHRYDSSRHYATNSYLHYFSLPIAYALVPATWPLLIVLNWTAGNRASPAFHDTEGLEYHDDWA